MYHNRVGWCEVQYVSVGAEVSQTNTSELKFLYESHEDFSTIPSFAVLPAMVCACVYVRVCVCVCVCVCVRVCVCVCDTCL